MLVDLDTEELVILQEILGYEIERADHEPGYDPDAQVALNSLCDKVDQAIRDIYE